MAASSMETGWYAELVGNGGGAGEAGGLADSPRTGRISASLHGASAATGACGIAEVRGCR